MLLTIPLLIFFIFLADKLDAMENDVQRPGELPFILISLPAMISLFISILMSFGSKSGNTWWFGMRKPFCNFIFETLPCLQQYANISYRFSSDQVDGDVQLSRPLHLSSPSISNNLEQMQMLRNDDRVYLKSNQPHPSIESPD